MQGGGGRRRRGLARTGVLAGPLALLLQQLAPLLQRRLQPGGAVRQRIRAPRRLQQRPQVLLPLLRQRGAAPDLLLRRHAPHGSLHRRPRRRHAAAPPTLAPLRRRLLRLLLPPLRRRAVVAAAAAARAATQPGVCTCVK
jgi:hypothetical protein